LPSFRLERAYRERFSRDMFDLSSSSPQALSARHVLDEAGVAPSMLLDAPMDYEPGGGSPDLRAGVAALFDNVTPDQVLIVAGAAEAIRVVTEATVAAGDLVVVQRPVYEALRAAPEARGGRLIDWTPSAGLHFDFTALPEEATYASAVFLNNPHGPGGSLVRGRYAGSARLIADEVYRPAAIFAGHRADSIIDMAPRAVSMGDISKPLGLGGLRIGWIVSRDQAFMRRCARVLDYHSASVSALSARVALAALERFDVHLGQHVERARANLQSLTAFMEEYKRWLEWRPPQAGYTAFPRLKSGGATALARRLASRGIFLLDGSPFDAPDHIRVGFGLDRSSFAEALAVLGEELRAGASPDVGVGDSPEADVIVLAKQPLAGLAKTRLAVEVGAARAAELCAAFVRDSLDLASTRARRLYVAASPSNSLSYFQLLAPSARCFAQPDGDLGARLLDAFETAIRDGARHPVLIGSDSPTVPAHLLTVAQQALRTHDVVIGPADDGGYYLIGMRVPHASLFERVDWSTERVLGQTLARAREARLDVFLLPSWYDVDEARDLERLASDPLLREHTRRALTDSRVEEVVA
jgi:rSAM/selenodomain-associated transferase 1